MNQSDIGFLQALKQVGFNRAKELFGFAEAYEGVTTPNASPKLKVSKTQLKLVEGVGAEIAAKFPKRGRQVDPNSNYQRVMKATVEFLQKQKGGATCTDIINHVKQATGLSEYVVRTNIYFVKGVERRGGWWKLPTLTEIRNKKAA